MILRLLSVICACLPIFGFSQNPSNTRKDPLMVAVSIVTAAQPDAPVRVISIERRMVPKRGAEPVVTVQNFTSKKVIALQVRESSAVPVGCSPLTWKPPYGVGRGDSFVPLDEIGPVRTPELAHLEIGPHSTAKLIADVYGDVMDLTGMKARYLQVQVGVEKVEFADGTTWTRTASILHKVFDAALLQADSARCSDWVWSDEAWPSDGVYEPSILEPDHRCTAEHCSTRPAVIEDARYTFFCAINGSTASCRK